MYAFRHAVNTAQIAPVCYGYPHVIDFSFVSIVHNDFLRSFVVGTTLRWAGMCPLQRHCPRQKIQLQEPYMYIKASVFIVVLKWMRPGPGVRIAQTL